MSTFRDGWLTTSPIGNYLVEAYYATSPPTAQWIKGHENIRVLTRIALVPLAAIARLELDRTLVICLTLLIITGPLAWTH